MRRVVVLPSRRVPVPDGVTTGEQTAVHYVADWYTPEEYGETYDVLERAVDAAAASETPWAWEDGALAAAVAPQLFTEHHGDLKHFYPFVRGVEDLLAADISELVLVWPDRDPFTSYASERAERHEVSLSVVGDERVPHPTPVASAFDRTRTSPSLVRALWVLLGIALMLLFGRLLPGGTDPEGRNVVYADADTREVTQPLLAADGVEVTYCPPALLGPLRALRRGSPGRSLAALRQAVRGDALHARDVLAVGPVALVRSVVGFVRLYRTRDELVALLAEAAEARDGVEDVPREYLGWVLADLLVKPSFLKHYLYLRLFEAPSPLGSMTVTNYGWTRALFVELGRRCDVPVVDLDHSVLRDDPLDYRCRAAVRLVKGHLEYDRLVDIDADGELHLTGRPYFDQLHDAATGDDADRAVPDEMAAWDDPLLVATEPIRPEHVEVVLERAFAAEAVDGVCIKLHPDEDPAEYRELLAERIEPDPPTVIVHREYPLADLLRAASCVVTVSSNVGLEALLLGTPAVHVDGPANIRLYYQTTREFERFRSPVSTLPETVDELVTTGISDATVESIREWYRFDGKSADRVLSVIDEVSGRSRSG